MILLKLVYRTLPTRNDNLSFNGIIYIHKDNNNRQLLKPLYIEILVRLQCYAIFLAHKINVHSGIINCI